MQGESETSAVGQAEVIGTAREEFRRALLHAHETHDSVGELESAAAHFCQALRSNGMAPERMLIEAKRVIEDAIDDHDRPVAEKAILSCIQHYYRS
jgi:hypothetical protein